MTAEFIILHVDDVSVVIADTCHPSHLSVTNDAERVVRQLDYDLVEGLGRRRLHYRDSMGRFDELRHRDGKFVGFSPCSEGQQKTLSALAAQHESS